jgi:hypothetical protein
MLGLHHPPLYHQSTTLYNNVNRIFHLCSRYILYIPCQTAEIKCWWSLTSLGSILPDLDSNPAICRTSQRTPVGKQCMLLRRLSTNRFVIVTRHLLVHLRYSCSRPLYSGDPSGPNFFRRSSGGNLKTILQTS